MGARQGTRSFHRFPRRTASHRPNRRGLPARLFRLLAVGSSALAFLFLLLVLLLRWLPVPTSAFMLQRQAAALLSGDLHFQLDHRWLPLSEMTPDLALAVVAAEDQKFPKHHGFDFEAMNMAWQHNQKGGSQRGASTISQQVAKNLFLWPGRSFVRKGAEAALTLLIEGLWPKRRILEVYLNIAEFGPGVFGAQAASEAFFHKPPAKLTALEAARLAAVLPNPLQYDAARPGRYVQNRTEHIRRQMRLLGTAYLQPILTP